MTDPLEKLLAEIEERAKAATPGKWDVCRQEPGSAGPTYVIRQGGAVYDDEICAFYVSPDGKTGNPDHVARMDPATTLKLVAIIRRQAEALESLAQYAYEQDAKNGDQHSTWYHDITSTVAHCRHDVAKIAEGVAG